MGRMTLTPPAMIRRTIMVAMASVALITVLSACTDANYDLDAEDAVGTWRAGSDLPTTLELSEDGTFQAIAWPIDAGCTENPPATAGELRTSEMIDFSGTWDEGDQGSQNDITLYPEDTGCNYSTIINGFRSEDGVLYTCHLLGVHVDLATAENWFILYHGEPEAMPDSGRCFNYN